VKLDLELLLAVTTALCGIISSAHGLKRKDWGMLYTGAGLVLCAAWLLMRTL
jgi:hypothetical protein